MDAGSPEAPMSMRRPPIPPLRPFVAELWISQPGTSLPDDIGRSRERVLPCAAMHIAIRLDDVPLRLFDDDADSTGRDLGVSIIGGARSGFYTKVSGRSHCTIGARLRPGAARALFGVGASELSERHTRLDDLWSMAVATLREQLVAQRSDARRLAMFETFLAARIPQPRGMHPAIAQALEDLEAGAGVREAVAASGYSHRRFIALFDDAVGLTPKRYSRVLRFQSLVRRARRQPSLSWSELAVDAGYSDQSHFIREFRALAGITPEDYRRLSLVHHNHLPIGAGTPT
jgi:AraC-like DNA-binding protein